MLTFRLRHYHGSEQHLRVMNGRNNCSPLDAQDHLHEKNTGAKRFAFCFSGHNWLWVETRNHFHGLFARINLAAVITCPVGEDKSIQLLVGGCLLCFFHPLLMMLLFEESVAKERKKERKNPLLNLFFPNASALPGVQTEGCRVGAGCFVLRASCPAGASVHELLNI